MSEAARRHHELSKHRPGKLVGAGTLDWLNEPAKVKSYLGAPEFKLPGPSAVAATFAQVVTGCSSDSAKAPSIEDLATLFHLGYGVTARRADYAFRAAPSAGALFSAEAYLCCGDLGALPAGLHYFNPLTASLVEIAAGDFRKSVAEALGGRPPAAAYVIITSIPWRAHWKYGRRAYRYCLLDAGHLACNLLLAGTALGSAPRLAVDFEERAIGRMLGLDEKDELPMALIELAAGLGNPVDPPALYGGRLAEPLSPHPLVDVEAATLHRREKGGADRRPPAPAAMPECEGLKLPAGKLPEGRLDELIVRRRSRRRGAKGSLELDNLSGYITALSWAYPADWVPKGWKANMLTDLRLVAMEIEGIEQGVYRYDPGRRELFACGVEFNRDALATACM
jgi:SagB-type dehydrogenase family enzyme